ncbi:DUF1816 domain-containing protein [Microcoleus sp. FACHB-1515]|uniref:DUF1816 domain-containing protein n=1 Tax=Cyanophyceae TaxID=3028117 RepID=UPI001685240B|nr:DUF1816 domain-containing protein [Microcoleus sp. FACHB-1515]MBD2092925.1 DUF1816 domain-containing protein [Microcoleus sp. FACHB-1515]
MQLLTATKEFFTGLLQSIGKQWWVEITTAEPRCTYYFGPFVRSKEAQDAHSGYVEDLQREGARDIQVHIRQCQPTVLTVCEEPEF